MPITELDYPILSQFGCAVERSTGMPPQPLDATPQQEADSRKKNDENSRPKPLPNGVVLGPDGRP